MREIKFRGRNIGTGEWVYGGMTFTRDGRAYIFGPSDLAYRVEPVDPDTVGQYTGLKDKNGAEIFEGDVIRENEKRTYLGHESRRSGIGVVKYGLCSFTADDPYCFSEVVAFHIDGQVFSPNPNDYGSTGLKIIGNIHENPNLLEAKA